MNFFFVVAKVCYFLMTFRFSYNNDKRYAVKRNKNVVLISFLFLSNKRIFSVFLYCITFLRLKIIKFNKQTAKKCSELSITSHILSNLLIDCSQLWLVADFRAIKNSGIKAL